MPVIPNPIIFTNLSGREIDSVNAFEFVLNSNSRVIREVLFFNKKTNQGYQYKIESKLNEEDRVVYFISVYCDELTLGLTKGVQNYSNYAFIGTVFNQNTFVYSEKSKVEEEDVSVKGFETILKMIYTNNIPSKLIVSDVSTPMRISSKVSAASSNLRFMQLMHSQNRKRFWGL